jgi:hypothetical protein
VTGAPSDPRTRDALVVSGPGPGFRAEVFVFAHEVTERQHQARSGPDSSCVMAMKSRAAAPETSLAATVAAEDLRAGQDVAVLNETFEFPSFLWNCDGSTTSRQDVVRIQCAARDSGTPLRIRAVCLPFVFVTDPNGARRVIDIRLAQLVRLDAAYSRLVRKQLRRRGQRPDRGATADEC